MAVATAPPKLKLVSSSRISSMAVRDSNGQKTGQGISKIDLMLIDKCSGEVWHGRRANAAAERLNDAAELNGYGWMDPIWEIRHRPGNVGS